MADQNLLTIFIAVTTVAVLIQTGLTAGLCYMSFRVSRQAERATEEARRYIEPLSRLVDTLDSTANRLAQFSGSSKGELHQFEVRLDERLNRVRRRLGPVNR